MRVLSVILLVCLGASFVSAQTSDTSESPSPQDSSITVAADSAGASSEKAAMNDQEAQATNSTDDAAGETADAAGDQDSDARPKASTGPTSVDTAASDDDVARKAEAPAAQTADSLASATQAPATDSAPSAEGDSAIAGDTADSASLDEEASTVGRLTIRTEPPKALLIVDGMPVGETPALVDSLAPGEHRIQISKKGHYTKKATVRVVAAKNQEVTFQLIKPCKLTVASTPDSAVVVINGVEVGPTPLTKSTLKPGSYRINVGKQGFVSRDTTVALGSGAHDTLRVELAEAAAAKPDSASAAAPPPTSTKATTIRALVSLGIFMAFSLVVLIVEVVRD